MDRVKRGIRDLQIVLSGAPAQPTQQHEPIDATISTGCASRNQRMDGFLNRDPRIQS
jgi:hypothetical protein